MASARADFHGLPLRIQTPTPRELLSESGVWLFVLAVGLLILFIAPEPWMNIAGLLLSLTGIWMVWDNTRYQIIQIDKIRVRVVEKQWIRKTLQWEEPISAFKGVKKIETLGLEKVTGTFIIELIHPDERKTLRLFSAAGTPRSGLFSTTDAEWEENEAVAIESAFKVGRILNLPVLDEQKDCP